MVFTVMFKARPCHVQRFTVIVVVSFRNRVAANPTRLTDYLAVLERVADRHASFVVIGVACPMTFRRLEVLTPALWALKSFSIVSSVVIQFLAPVIPNIFAGAFLALSKVTITHRWMRVKLVERFYHFALKAFLAVHIIRLVIPLPHWRRMASTAGIA